MPYAPGITYDTQSLGAGIGSAGQSLSDGLREYAQNKRLDATVTGQIDAYLRTAAQNGPTPQFTPGTQKLADKLTQGKATLNDKLTLLGSLQTEQQIKTEEQQRQARAMQMRMQAQQLQQAQVAAASDAQARARLTQLSQYMNGAGQGVLNPQAQANLAAQAKNPMLTRAAQAYQATGDVPKSDTLLNDSSREEIANLRAQQAEELFKLKQEQAGGYGSAEDAVKAARTAGANSVTVQQNTHGRWLANATFTDPTKAAKMSQADLQRAIGLRTRISQVNGVITQIRAGSMTYPMQGKLPELERELKTLQAEFDTLTKPAPPPPPPTAPEVDGITVRKLIPPVR